MSPGQGGKEQGIAVVAKLLLTAFSATLTMGFGVFTMLHLAAGPATRAVPEALVAVVLGAALAALLLREEWSLLELRAIEVSVFATVAIFLGAQAYGLGVADLQSAGGGTTTWNAVLLRFALLMAAYGVFVPNKPARAVAIVAAIGSTPLLVAAVVRFRHPELSTAFDRAASEQVFDTALLLGASAAVGIFAALVINKYYDVAYSSRRDTFYDLHELIGRGGMGEVWKASHRALARPAAVKLIREDKLDETDRESARRLLLRFEQEARATANLRSPHTVQVYDAGITADGHFYYAMEYLDGLDLETLGDRFGPVPPERCVHFLLQACDSLADAHDSGLTHRDIKPANMHLSRRGPSSDYVKLLDFGLVKLDEPADETGRLTAEGTTTGTPAYMAPEMAVQRDIVDGRADIYALGCVAYWLISGKPVFEASNNVALIVEHVKTAPVPPSQRTGLPIPGELEAIILKCLEKDPADRFQTAGELAEALSAVDLPERWTAERAESWWDFYVAQAEAA